MVQGANRLTAQRWLQAGLIAVFLLSASLYWMLRSGGGRTRGSPPEPAQEGAASAELAPPAADPTAGTEPSPGATPAEGERSEVVLATAPPEAAGEDFDPGAIVGRVLSKGEPVEGVELRLFPGQYERRERVTPLARTATDAEGRFRLRGLSPHVRHTLHLQHPDYLPEDETLFPGRSEDVEIEPAATVSGIVRSAHDSQALAGVEVALERWHYTEGGPRERVSAVTGDDGRWRLPWAEVGIERFLVLRPGFLPEQREFQVAAAGGEGFEIWLEDAPVLELEVYSLESNAALVQTELLSDDQPVRTDERGHLRLPRPTRSATEESVRLSLGLPGGCQTQARIVPSEVHGFVRVPVVLGGTVRGRVLDGSGAGVPGALVRLSGGGRAPSTAGLPPGFWLSAARTPVRSGSDGGYALAGLAPREGSVEVRAQHPDYPSGRSQPFTFAELDARPQVDVVLEPGGSIRGTVRLEGEPAALRVFWENEHGGGWTRADDRGQYEIVGVRGGETNVRARAEDEDEDVPRPEDVVVLVAAGEVSTADFDLREQRALIRGRVIDARGAPVAEAEIVALPTHEDDWRGDEPRAESALDGRFELLVPDTPGLTFEVSAESGPRRAEASEVRAGADNVELVLPVLTEVAVRVRDAVTREPVSNFTLYWRDAENGSFERLDQGGRRLSPGADGTFLAELPAGRLDLCVAARSLGYAPALSEDLELSGGGTVDFELERGVELELQVQVAEDAAEALRQLQRGRVSIASAEQWADREHGGDFYQREVRDAQAVRLDQTGVARIQALAGGRYRFSNVPKGFRFRPDEFELPPVAQQRVEVILEAQPRKRERE